MTFKEECLAAFIEYIDHEKIDANIRKHVIEAFSTGFEYGSLNGASEEIKKSVVNNLKPIKNEKAREIIRKMREIIQ